MVLNQSRSDIKEISRGVDQISHSLEKFSSGIRRDIPSAGKYLQSFQNVQILPHGPKLSTVMSCPLVQAWTLKTQSLL